MSAHREPIDSCIYNFNQSQCDDLAPARCLSIHKDPVLTRHEKHTVRSIFVDSVACRHIRLCDKPSRVH
eukprot:scaffold49726_cov27-Tisochrysis_lutea.AAC.4